MRVHDLATRSTKMLNKQRHHNLKRILNDKAVISKTTHGSLADHGMKNSIHHGKHLFERVNNGWEWTRAWMYDCNETAQKGIYCS